MQNIETLREAMFKQLEALNNPALSTQELKLAIDKAHAVSKVADTILASGRLELEYMRAMERIIPLTEFIPDQSETKKFTADHSARVAAEMRANWSLSNQEKVKALNESKTGS
jgi:hypothetical protein